MRNRFFHLKDFIVIAGIWFMLFGLFDYSLRVFAGYIPSLVFLILFLITAIYLLRLAVLALQKKILKRVVFYNALFTLLSLMAASAFTRISYHVFWSMMS